METTGGCRATGLCAEILFCCVQMQRELSGYAGASSTPAAVKEAAEPLQKLAAELALVAAAVAAGTRGYVLGRSHGM